MTEEHPAESPQGESTSDAPPSDAHLPDEADQGSSGLPSRRSRRSRSRRPNRQPWMWPRVTIAAALALVLLLLGLWPGMKGRMEAAEQLTQAEALLAQAKGTVAHIDESVATQLSSQAEPSVPSVAADILVARRELTTASKLIDDAMPHLTSEEQQRASLMKTTAKARLVMIDTASSILKASVKAVQAKTIGDRAWRLTRLSANVETRAARNYAAQHASKVESAAVAMVAAMGQLAEARPLYSQAASAFPEAGFERYVAYTDQRRKQVGLLANVTTQWLDGNRDEAADLFADYETAAAKSAKALAALPAAPGNATGTAFRKVAGRAADAYKKAQQDALRADKALANP
jgi:hypothetical protein